MNKTLHHLINSNENGYTFNPDDVVDKNILHIIHNAGLFSCSSIALEEIMIYYNQYKKLPDAVRRETQYMYYKSAAWDNLIPLLFKETEDAIPYERDARITYDDKWFQWSDYKLIDFESVKPFVNKYFQPSDKVLERVAQLEQDYQIDYKNTVGVLYRGNDKQKECSIAPYEAFGQRIINVVKEDFGVQYKEDRIPRILVSPDETEFYDYMSNVWDARFVAPSQWLHMPKDSNTAIFMHLPHSERPEHAINTLAMIIMLSKCKHLVTHSGNMSFWCVLYRGHMNNVHQWREGQWI